MSKVNKLTEDQVDEFKEVFGMFDKDKDNRINLKELNSVMKYLGQNLTPNQLVDLVGGANGSIDYNKWLEYMAEKFVVEDSQEDVIQAFEVFDRDGRGYISNPELRYVLTCVGDKLDEQDVELMLSQADQGDGMIDYRTFVRLLIPEAN